MQPTLEGMSFYLRMAPGTWFALTIIVLTFQSLVTVPSWPIEGDMVLVKGDDVEPWRALVQTVRSRAMTIKALFYVPHPRWGRESNLWVREGSVPQDISWKSILEICKGSWRGQGRGMFKEDD